MSARGERVLIQYLTEKDALDVLAAEGLPAHVLPSEALRPIYSFALDYYFKNGRAKAPSIAAIRSEERWANALDDAEIDLEADPEDSVEWAIDALKGTFVHKQVMNLNKALATDMAEAATDERVDVLGEYASRFVALSVELQSSNAIADVRIAMRERVSAYESREADREEVYGLRFGIREIDAYTRGVHPGELAVVGAPPKTGKSYFLDRVALSDWQSGRVPVLFTLENSVEMTLDRIACMACGVDARKWQHGDVAESDVERVRHWVNSILAEKEQPLWVLQPPPGQRTVTHMVRQAQVLGADSLLIDQLTFLEHDGDPRRPKHERLGESLHILAAMISTGRDRMPCLAAHQMKREAVVQARKTGRLEMDGFADSAEVERTASWAFGLYQSMEQRAARQALFQTLACRRDDNKNFELKWDVNSGLIGVIREARLTDEDE